MQTNLGVIDTTILILYGCALIAMGIYYRRKCRTSEQFMIADHSIPAWAAGLAVMSAYTSSISYIATPGMAFDSNWHPMIFALCIFPVAWIVCRYAVPYYRKAQLISAYSFLEDRLGSWGRIYAAFAFVLYMITRVAVILYLASLLLDTFVRWDIATVIIIIGLVTVVYTLLGGMEAVIWTDVIQSLIMIVGILFCAISLSIQVMSGPEPLIQAAFDDNKFGFGSLELSLASQQHLRDRTIWVMVIYGTTEAFRSLLADQNYVQKYCTVPSERDAKRSIWIAMLIYIPLTAVFLYIGTTLFAFYSNSGELLRVTELLNDQGKVVGDRVFPYFIATRVPPGLKGLIIAAIIAAAMSTVDSALNCSATVLLLDFYKRYFKPNIGEKASLAFLRITTVLWGVLGTGAALLMIKAKSILDIWWQISGVFGGALLGLFVLAFLRARLRPWQGVVSIGVSVAVVAWGTFARDSFLGKFNLEIVESWKWIECNLDAVIVGATGATAFIIVAGAFALANRGRSTATSKESGGSRCL